MHHAYHVVLYVFDSVGFEWVDHGVFPYAVVGKQDHKRQKFHQVGVEGESGADSGLQLVIPRLKVGTFALYLQIIVHHMVR